MSCKLWGKVTSVSVNIDFCAKMSILCKTKIEVLGDMLTFSLKVHYYWKWLSFCKICLYLEKCDFLCEGLYTLIKYQILIKNFNFLGFANLYMGYFSVKYFIFRKIVILIQNIIIFNDTLGKSVIFLVKSTLHLAWILWRNWAIFWERC